MFGITDLYRKQALWVILKVRWSRQMKATSLLLVSGSWQELWVFSCLIYSQEPGGCASKGAIETALGRMFKRSKGSSLGRGEEVPSFPQPGSPTHFLRAEGRVNTPDASRQGEAYHSHVPIFFFSILSANIYPSCSMLQAHWCVHYLLCLKHPLPFRSLMLFHMLFTSIWIQFSQYISGELLRIFQDSN